MRARRRWRPRTRSSCSAWTRERQVYIGEAKVALEELEEKLANNAKAQADKEVYLYADRDIPYGIVVEVMAAAQRAGIGNVGMITDPSAAPRTSKKKEARR